MYTNDYRRGNGRSSESRREGAFDHLAHARTHHNLGGAERLVSTAAGGALVTYGIAQRTLTGALAAAAGTALLVHGLRQRSDVYRAAGITDEDAGFWSHPFNREVVATSSLTINRPAEELHRAWRKTTDLIRYFDHVESIDRIDEDTTQWVADGPMGKRIEWKAEITADEPGRRIAWRSFDSNLFDQEGEILFEPAPGGRGTRATLTLCWHPPAGVVGALAARMMPQDPQHETREGLRRFKQWMEAGEIATAVMQRGDAGPLGHTGDADHRSSRDDIVDESSRESFPASDAPAWRRG